MTAVTWWRIRTMAAVLIIPPLLHLRPLHRLAGRLDRGGSRSCPPLPLERLVDWVDILLHRLPWPWKFTCLKRAAVLYALLRRGGMPVELRVGVRRDAGGELAAHAWLVRDGAPYLETAQEILASFQIIATFPEARGLLP